MPELPRAQITPQGLPEMRHLQGSRRPRSQGSLAPSVASLTDIALDAMGSDKAPEPEIKGAIQACRHLPVRVHLVGPEDRLREGLREASGGEELPIAIVPASEWITMDDKAGEAIRKKKGSTMRVG